MENINNAVISYPYQNLSLEDMPNEEWLPIAWSKDKSVLCSNMGRVKSFNTKSRKTFVIVKQMTKDGYCKVQIDRYNKRRTFLVHRVVGKLFVPNPFNLPEINHKFGRKLDNRYTEIEWATRKLNVRHSVDVLGNFKGVNSPVSSLLISDVLHIFYSTKPQREIAAKYNISHSIVGQIQRKKSYIDIVGNLQRQKRAAPKSTLMPYEVIAIYNSKLKRKDALSFYGITKHTYHNIKSKRSFSNLLK